MHREFQSTNLLLECPQCPGGHSQELRTLAESLMWTAGMQPLEPRPSACRHEQDAGITSCSRVLNPGTPTGDPDVLAGTCGARPSGQCPLPLHDSLRSCHEAGQELQAQELPCCACDPAPIAARRYLASAVSEQPVHYDNFLPLARSCGCHTEL